MPPKKNQKPEVPVTLTCVEEIPHSRVTELLTSDIEIVATEYPILIEYLNTRKITRRYKATDKSPNGRIYCAGLQQLSRPLRGYLCQDTYVDVDLVCAHPTILLNLAKTFKSRGSVDIRDDDISQLKDYIDNYKKRKAEKLDVIKIINGMDSKYSKLDKEFTKALELLRLGIINKVMSMDEYGIAGSDTKTAMFRILEIEERKIIDSVVEYIENSHTMKKVEVIANCFDGLVLKGITQEHIDTINEGKYWKLAIKPWEIPKLKTLHKLENFNWAIKSNLWEILNRCDHFESLGEMDKAMLPLVLANVRIDNTGLYIYRDKYSKSYSTMSKIVGNLSKWAVKCGLEKPTVYDFPTLVQRYSSLIRVIGIDTFSTAPKTFSTWVGHKFDEVSKVDEGNVKYFKDYLLETICDKNDEILNYLLNWLAFVIQKPGKKTEVGIVIQGLGGSGKSTLISFLYKFIFGSGSAYKGQGLGCLTEQWNHYLEGVSLAVIEELKSAKSDNWTVDLDTLKDIITDETLTVRKKFQDPRTSVNALNVIGVTNHTNSVPMTEENVRRFMLLKCSSEKIGEIDTYWKPLYQKMSNQEFANHIGTYLLRRDISDFQPRLFPSTELARENACKWIKGVKLALYCTYIDRKCEESWITTGEVIRSAEKYHIEAVKKLKGKVGIEIKEYLGPQHITKRRYHLKHNDKTFKITEDMLDYARNYMKEVTTNTWTNNEDSESEEIIS